MLKQSRGRSHVLNVTSEDGAGSLRSREMWNQNPGQSYER